VTKTQDYKAATAWIVNPSGDQLLSQSTTTYDSLGEVSQTATYLVNSSTSPSTVGSAQTTSYSYDAAGNQVALVDPVGNVTTWAYDGLGEATQSSQGQILAAASSPVAFNNLTLTPSQSRSFEVYVHFATAPGSNWQSAYSASDGSGTLTITAANGTAPQLGGGWYDLGSVTLGSSDASSSLQVAYSSGSPDQIALVGYSDQEQYNGAGQLTEKVDRDGRATTYTYDGLGRETQENWFSSTNTSGTPAETLSFAYDSAGRLHSATDATTSTTASNTYAYDAAGRVTSDTQQIPGLTPAVVLSDTYTAGNRTQLAASIGGVNDFVNNYQYNSVLGQMSQVTQESNGGNSVAVKTATFAYNNLGEFSTVKRYQNSTTANLVATAAYGYDSAGQLTSINYSDGQSTPATLDNFAWTYDALGNVATSSSSLDAAGAVTYSNDSTGQLTGASGGQAPNESYQYDANGNRNSTGYSTGWNNELLSDGTFNYAYDAEGNMISRTQISTASASDYTTLYTWDDRNRLTSVTMKDNSGNVTQTVTYIYDAFNRWIGETIATSAGTTQTRYAYDGNQIVLQFDGAGTDALTASDLSHRYLWGPAVDQLMADEQVVNGLSQTGNVVWALTDNLNTVRDLATYDPAGNGGQGATTIVNHRVFSAYGELLSQTNPATGGAAAVDCLFAYTGRPLDTATGLQNNDNRWYDAVTGRWLSQDPISFAAGDANLYRYVGNGPVTMTDASGLAGGDDMIPAKPTRPASGIQTRTTTVYLIEPDGHGGWNIVGVEVHTQTRKAPDWEWNPPFIIPYTPGFHLIPPPNGFFFPSTTLPLIPFQSGWQVTPPINGSFTSLVDTSGSASGWQVILPANGSFTSLAGTSGLASGWQVIPPEDGSFTSLGGTSGSSSC
jgi:RHS repeat-associated protein